MFTETNVLANRSSEKTGLLDFFIVKDLSANYVPIKNTIDLSSDHSTPYAQHATVIRKKQRALTSRNTNWNNFRKEFDRRIEPQSGS